MDRWMDGDLIFFFCLRFCQYSLKVSHFHPLQEEWHVAHNLKAVCQGQSSEISETDVHERVL